MTLLHRIAAWLAPGRPVAPSAPPREPQSGAAGSTLPVASHDAGAAFTLSRFDACLSIVLAHEGGFVDHPRDPGGATNMGITHRTLAQWRGKPVTKMDVRNISRAEVEAIYRDRYWTPLRCDGLPGGVDLAVFDFGVNSGVLRAARFLQAAVEAPVDGVIGPVTIKAARLHDPAALVNRLCDDRLAFLRDLATWDAFGRGWARRVEDVRAKALRLAGYAAAIRA